MAFVTFKTGASLYGSRWTEQGVISELVKSSTFASVWAEFDASLAQKLAETRITDEDAHLTSTCLQELTLVAPNLGKGWGVRAFGSTCNGFARHGSDLDATCCRQASVDFPEPFLPDLLEDMARLLEEQPNFTIVEKVMSARIPILRMKFKQVLDVDLSFQNIEPLPNTQLLRSYVSLDTCIRDLGVLVKLWAHAAGVCGAPNGHLSAYSFTLMVIYFLQVDPDLRLPVLPTARFDGSATTPLHPHTWRCGLGMAQMLCRFFIFFAEQFQWGSEVVSVRTGRRLSASDDTFSELRGRFASRLHVEDPFLLHRNLQCALCLEQENELYTKLWEAAQAFRQGFLPVGLQASPDTGHQMEVGMRMPLEEDTIDAPSGHLRQLSQPSGDEHGLLLAMQNASKECHESDSASTRCTLDGPGEGEKASAPAAEDVPVTLLLKTWKL